MDKLFKDTCNAICKTRCSNYKQYSFYGYNGWACACDMDNTKCVLCQSYLREQFKKKENKNDNKRKCTNS